jgi:tRNA pseudouridine38-40 synthase
MVGTLIYINEGKIGESDIKEIILSLDRKKAGKTVSPEGLYLNKVNY